MVHPESSQLIIIETEHNAYTEETKKQRRVQMAQVNIYLHTCALVSNTKVASVFEMLLFKNALFGH